MSNFTEVKTGGWVNGEEITGAQQTGIQARLLKAPNADDGSSHAGVLTLGGLTTSHFTDKYLLSGPHSGASVTVACDFSQYSFFDIVRSRSAAGGAMTWTFSNIKQGDRYRFLYRPTTPNPGGTARAYTITRSTMTGTITHSYARTPWAGGYRAIAGIGANGTGIARLGANDVGVGELIYFPLNLAALDGETLSAVKLRVDPANNTLPGTNKVTLSVVQLNQSTGAETTIASLEDPLTGAAYQAAHDLELTAIDHVIDASAHYYVTVFGETGTNADAATLLGGFFAIDDSTANPRQTTGCTLWEAIAVSDTRLFWRKLLDTDSGPFF